MALISYVRGRVVRIEPFDDGFNKARVVLADAAHRGFAAETPLEGEQGVLTPTAIPDLAFGVGAVVRSFAFERGDLSESTWEAEDFKVLGQTGEGE
jgi:hypothetical protein